MEPYKNDSIAINAWITSTECRMKNKIWNKLHFVS